MSPHNVGRKTFRTVALATLALACVAGPARAQIRIPRITLVTGLGTAGVENVGRRTLGNGDTAFAWHAGTKAFTLGLDTGTPLRWLDLRLAWQHAAPTTYVTTFRADSFAGVFNLGRERTETVTLAAVARLPRVLDAQPYLLAGGGFKHFAMSQALQDGREVHSVDKAVLNAGAGVSWNVGRYDLFVEGAVTRYDMPHILVPEVGHAAEYRKSLTFGLRIPIHR
jgi:hypothetical protein